VFFDENSEVFCFVHHKNIHFVIYYTRARALVHALDQGPLYLQVFSSLNVNGKHPPLPGDFRIGTALRAPVPEGWCMAFLKHKAKVLWI